MRACPASDLCFALDRTSRAFRPNTDATKAMAPRPDAAAVVIAASMEALIIEILLQRRDKPRGSHKKPVVGGSSLFAVEPHPASAGESVLRLVQPHRFADASPGLDRGLA